MKFKNIYTSQGIRAGKIVCFYVVVDGVAIATCDNESDAVTIVEALHFKQAVDRLRANW